MGGKYLSRFPADQKDRECVGKMRFCLFACFVVVAFLQLALSRCQTYSDYGPSKNAFKDGTVNCRCLPL